MSYLAITILSQPEVFLLLNKMVFIIVMKLLPNTVKNRFVTKILFNFFSGHLVYAAKERPLLKPQDFVDGQKATLGALPHCHHGLIAPCYPTFTLC